MELVDENIRINESLVKNDKLTIDAVYRSKSEKDKLMQQMAEAEKMNNVAKAYFNFLINRDLTSEIDVFDKHFEAIETVEIGQAKEHAKANREELKLLDSYGTVQDYMIKVNKGGRLPTLALVADYGIQGEEYKFTDEDDYATASLVLRWDIFKGFQNKAKIMQTKIDRDITDFKIREVEQQINLQVINSFYSLEAAGKSVTAATSQVTSAEAAFNIVNKQYKEGIINYIQWLDAKTAMFNSKENLIITKFDLYNKYADFEKVTAKYEFKEKSLNENTTTE